MLFQYLGQLTDPGTQHRQPIVHPLHNAVLAPQLYLIYVPVNVNTQIALVIVVVNLLGLHPSFENEAVTKGRILDELLKMTIGLVIQLRNLPARGNEPYLPVHLHGLLQGHKQSIHIGPGVIASTPQNHKMIF
ncbi:MAG: hypothetical protein DDT18_01418 [Actinobacteria bacterium]|nr:hypothetical protein [Actinomycetota bacterium]